MKRRLRMDDSVFEETIVPSVQKPPLSQTPVKPGTREEWRETFFDWQLTGASGDPGILLPGMEVTADVYVCTSRILKKLRYRMAQDMNAGEMTNGFAMEASTILIEALVFKIPRKQLRADDPYAMVCSALYWLAEHLQEKDRDIHFKELDKSPALFGHRPEQIYAARHFVGAARFYIGAL